MRKALTRFTILPDVVLSDDPGNDQQHQRNLEETVSEAVDKARCNSNRHFAEALHCQADVLHHRGDYEAALVLYYKARSLHPKDESHAVAVERTMAALSSSINPTPEMKKLMCKARNPGQMAAMHCPETAALRSKRILRESRNFVEDAKRVVKHFDSLKYSLLLPEPTSGHISSKAKFRQLTTAAKVAMKSLQVSFECRDFDVSLRLGDELLRLVGAGGVSGEFHGLRVEAHRMIALSHARLGRHDRAICCVSKMIYLVTTAKRDDDHNVTTLRLRSLRTLGEVHLHFGHYHATARAWENLLSLLDGEPVPRSWLLHEIGRCYLEIGDYVKALAMAKRCCKLSERVSSSKWLLHGKLLEAQVQARIGNLEESRVVLKQCLTTAESDEILGSTVSYVRALNERVTRRSRETLATVSKSRKIRKRAKYIVESSSSEGFEDKTTSRTRNARRSSGKTYRVSSTQVDNLRVSKRGPPLPASVGDCCCRRLIIINDNNDKSETPQSNDDDEEDDDDDRGAKVGGGDRLEFVVVGGDGESSLPGAKRTTKRGQCGDNGGK